MNEWAGGSGVGKGIGRRSTNCTIFSLAPRRGVAVSARAQETVRALRGMSVRAAIFLPRICDSCGDDKGNGGAEVGILCVSLGGEVSLSVLYCIYMF